MVYNAYAASQQAQQIIEEHRVKVQAALERDQRRFGVTDQNRNTSYKQPQQKYNYYHPPAPAAQQQGVGQSYNADYGAYNQPSYASALMYGINPVSPVNQQYTSNQNEVQPVNPSSSLTPMTPVAPLSPESQFSLASTAYGYYCSCWSCRYGPLISYYQQYGQNAVTTGMPVANSFNPLHETNQRQSWFSPMSDSFVYTNQAMNIPQNAYYDSPTSSASTAVVKSDESPAQPTETLSSAVSTTAELSPSNLTDEALVDPSLPPIPEEKEQEIKVD